MSRALVVLLEFIESVFVAEKNLKFIQLTMLDAFLVETKGGKYQDEKTRR